MTFVDAFKNGLWPDGKLKPPDVPRTADEKERTRDEANRKLSALMPGVVFLPFLVHALITLLQIWLLT